MHRFLGFYSFAWAAALALVLGRACMALAVRLHWVDKPGHRKVHVRAVPYLGGVAFLLALIGSMALVFLLSAPADRPGFSAASMLACLMPAVGAGMLGFWDDIQDMPARWKFLGQFILAFAFSQFGYRICCIHFPGFVPLGLDPSLSVVITTFFIMAIANGFNMIDGSDALCLGVGISSLGVLALAAARMGQPHLVDLALAAIGASAGVLYWNRPPARIYLGDAGSQAIGFLVATLCVALGGGQPGSFSFAGGPQSQPFRYQLVAACLIAGVPSLEVLLTVVRRTLQGRSLGRADQGHIHHRLRKVGAFGARGVAVAAVIVNVMCGALALALIRGDTGVAALLIALLAAVLTFGFWRLGYGSIFETAWLDDRRPHFLAAGHYMDLQSTKLQLAAARGEVLVLIEHTCQEIGVHECRVTLRDISGVSHRSSWSWVDPHPPALPARLMVKPRPTDRVRLMGSRNHASWSMDPEEREPELNMNMRVLMVEFMRKALDRLVEFAEQEHGPSDVGVTLKAFKQRLQSRRRRPEAARH